MTKYYLGPDGNLYTEDELRHWGIPGMKWGVRRFQNKDGSLTSAGKKRRYATDLTSRKQSIMDDPAKRKKQVDADKREADNRVKFYDSKHAAKKAIDDEAAVANHHVNKHARDQIAYTNESEYGPAVATTPKKTK